MGFEASPRDPSLADPLPASPLPTLGRWIAEAREHAGLRNPDAVALATTDAAGRPEVRMVLCRGVDLERGVFAFYTNRASAKGRALAARPYASMAFYWDGLGRQARLSGPVREAPDADSDAYFASRPRLSQLAALASAQSEPVASRAALLERIERAAARFGGVDGREPVPRPPHWGGTLLVAERIELWVHSDGRAHDRGLWTRRVEPRDQGDRRGDWDVVRLQP
jgi:pyridoxamine 5'-phosphate oxidase